MIFTENKPDLYQMEKAMAEARADFIATQSNKYALRAINENGAMVRTEFDNCKDAIKMARDFWIQGYLYVEVFSLNNEKFLLHYHSVRNY